MCCVRRRRGVPRHACGHVWLSGASSASHRGTHLSRHTRASSGVARCLPRVLRRRDSSCFSNVRYLGACRCIAWHLGAWSTLPGRATCCPSACCNVASHPGARHTLAGPATRPSLGRFDIPPASARRTLPRHATRPAACRQEAPRSRRRRARPQASLSSAVRNPPSRQAQDALYARLRESLQRCAPCARVVPRGCHACRTSHR